MAGDITVDGMTRVGFATAIANIQAPTTTELNAGIVITSVMTPTGLMGFEPTTQPVDNSALDSVFNTKTTGRDDFSDTALEFKKQSGTDTAYATLVRGTVGFVIIRRDILSATAWTSAQAVEVYPIICGQTKRLTPGINEVTKFQVPVFITLTPALRAAIA